MRAALWLVAIVDFCCVLLAMVGWARLSKVEASTGQDAFGAGLLRIELLVIIVLLGLASCGVLSLLARSSNPTKWGAVAIFAGLSVAAGFALFTSQLKGGVLFFLP